ncbi:MAG: DUF2852 domain-containing protein [Rubellimicrobium sp.]|nr:DUF2852 domain-containing protein [Rubellimicrobium sp.]
MSTTDLYPPALRPAHDGTSWFHRSEAWLDDKGKGAWIAAMVLGFVFFWPVGLALLAYMIWSKRMFTSSGSCRNARQSGLQAAERAARPSGNSAFDAYKTETLRRLQDEQQAFEEFLARLRAAKDKAEFDQFMDDRARNVRPEQGAADGDTDGTDTPRS